MIDGYDNSVIINKENTPITIIVNDVPTIAICGNSVEIRNFDSIVRDGHSKHGSIIHLQR